MIQTQKEVNKETIKALKRIIKKIEGGNNVFRLKTKYNLNGDPLGNPDDWDRDYHYVSVVVDIEE